MGDKQDVKAQRVRGYFLEAAKQIISTQGVENLSARKVAEMAGYSYATIYNYFKDMDALLWETKAWMVSDTAEHMRNAVRSAPKRIEDLRALFAKYVRYHLDHPHVFRFFYFHKLADDASRNASYDFSAQWLETLRFCIEDGRLQEDEVESCAKSLVYAVHGLIALYFSGNGLTEETLFADLNQLIDFIVRR